MDNDPQYLEHGTNMATELETKMNAVERVKEYVDLPEESEHDTDPVIAAALPHSWPAKGLLEVSDLRMRYRPSLPLVLKDVTFVAAAGEKLGICGRTGSGKSSLFLALFRIIEPAGGVIKIDGVDVSTLGLHQLRSKMAMIPQDPFMFAGTIRNNLDPFDEHDDAAVWSALEQVGLKHMAEDAAKKLDMEVVDNGGNFSLGQARSITTLVPIRPRRRGERRSLRTFSPGGRLSPPTPRFQRPTHLDAFQLHLTHPHNSSGNCSAWAARCFATRAS